MCQEANESFSIVTDAVCWQISTPAAVKVNESVTTFFATFIHIPMADHWQNLEEPGDHVQDFL